MTDTIFGYSWEQIQAAQQGKQFKTFVTPSKKPEATEGDLALLREHGEDGLEAKGFLGVIDRLKTSGAI